MRRLIVLVGLALCLAAVTVGQQPSPAQDGTTSAANPKPKVTAPKAIDTPNPEPARDGGKGPTVFSVLIGTDGLVHDPRMIKSSDSKQADANALAAIQKWRFKPAMKNGAPVPVMINIEVDSRIH